VNSLNHYADVVAEDFSEHLIEHRHVALAANAVTKLGLDHAEHRLDVGAPVVVVKEPSAGSPLHARPIGGYRSRQASS